MAIVTLTTDFGTFDGYVAQMKGVLLSNGPADLRMIDLAHDIPAQDVMSAALLAEAAFPRFPAGTVHVMVVDPGVGSVRRGMIARLQDQYLVGPDNGVFSLLYDGREELVGIDLAKLPGPIASTFHGRDVFAPAAAMLLCGTRPDQLGEQITDPVRLQLPIAKFTESRVRGEVIHVDRFGNLITNLRVAELMRWSEGNTLAVTYDTTHVVPMCDHYAQVPSGDLLAICDSSGRLEVAVRDGNAHQKLAARVGMPVHVHQAVSRRR
ncbi:MAG: SAM-dependent chlorinase/fluorinase [Myxococcales bacterium]|nr:SAM-dependent chlorinase/fluorinase [Myxococcales bacterium]